MSPDGHYLQHNRQVHLKTNMLFVPGTHCFGQAEENYCTIFARNSYVSTYFLEACVALPVIKHKQGKNTWWLLTWALLQKARMNIYTGNTQLLKKK